VKVGAADPAVRHLEPDFVSATFAKPMLVDAMILTALLKRLTGWISCRGEYRPWRGSGLLAWSPCLVSTKQIDLTEKIAKRSKAM
jgi:hypothetical protein